MEVLSEIGISLWTLVLIGLIFVLHRYLTRNFDFWEKRGVHGPKPRILFGTIKPLWKYRVEEQDMENFKKYGRTYGVFESTHPALVTTDPDLIKQITVKDFSSFPNRRDPPLPLTDDKYLRNMLAILRNEEWKIVRNTLTPTFTTGKLKQMIYLIEESVNELIASLESSVDAEKSIDIKNQLSVLTLDIIASCAFGTKIDCIQNPETEFITKIKKIGTVPPVVAYFMIIFSGILKYIPSKILPNPFKYFADFANKTIDMRLQNKQSGRKDFLEIMLNAEIQDNIEDNKDNDELIDSEKEKPTHQKKTLTREVVIAQTILFLISGYESVATVLSFVAYELAINPNIQEKLIAEIDDMMSQNKGKLTYEAIANMQYLEMVLSETLRRYPPGARLERLCEKDDYNLNGITLDRGMAVSIAVHTLHHDPEFYPNPYIFDPERFSPENKAKRNPFTYIPFGIGPRNCIAMRFALMEAKIIIIMMMSKFRFQSSDETDIPVKYASGVGVIQPKSLKLLLQNRTDQPNHD